MTAFPCRKCGRDTTHSVELSGIVSAIQTVCEPCFDEFMVGLEENRRQFAELIGAGVPRDEANRIMIARIDGQAAS